jgi:HK97 family phage major capsid protein
VSDVDITAALADPDAAARSTDLVPLMRAIDAEIGRLAELDNPTPAEERRFDGCVALFERCDSTRKRREVRSALNGGGARTIPGDYGAAYAATGRQRPGRERSVVEGEALRQIERAAAVGQAADDVAERLTVMVERGHVAQRTAVARWAAVTGDPDYCSAWLKRAADPEDGHSLWTPAERAAWQAVRRYEQEERAMSLTDTAGGYLVPAHLDPAVILTNAGILGSVRQLARVETIAGDVWNGVSSAGVTATWRAEAAETTDASPTLAQPTVPVYKYDGYVPISIEAIEDAANAAEQVARMLVDGADRLQEQTFLTGSGSGQPTGIVTALTGTSSVVASAGSDTFAAGDLTALKAALPARWQLRGRFAMAGATIDTAAAFVNGNVLRFPGLSQVPPTLLNRPVAELSGMDSTYGSGDNYVAIYGDWSQYLIVDRVGTRIEFIPHVFGSNHRPTGQRAWYMFGRVGADCLVDDAFRMLNVT